MNTGPLVVVLTSNCVGLYSISHGTGTWIQRFVAVQIRAEKAGAMDLTEFV